MKLEILEKGCFYHIYNRGINSDKIFVSDENKIYFLKLMSKYLDNVVDFYSYCLMDNHFHFIVRIIEEEKIVTQKLSNLFNSYVKAFNKQNDRTGSLFEKHFKRIKLNDNEYLKNLIMYVHLNPKHHLDLDFKKYKFSSYQTVISEKFTRIKRKEVIELFENLDNFIFCHNQKNDFLTEKYTFE